MRADSLTRKWNWVKRDNEVLAISNTGRTGVSEQTIRVEPMGQPAHEDADSLFESFHWLYAFCG